MSLSTPRPHNPVVVRAGEAEYLAPIGHYLLADSSATGGALSTHRVSLGSGGEGASPHHHDRSSELFFMLDGALDVLVGNDVVTAEQGDLLVIPPELDHAFSAHRGSRADVLIVISPGIERFEYLRQVTRIREGRAPHDSLLSEQQRYDTHFVTSATWQRARTAT
jgi:mannose-6-phosphate isomerase-like protein (cupin superfamily)